MSNSPGLRGFPLSSSRIAAELLNFRRSRAVTRMRPAYALGILKPFSAILAAFSRCHFMGSLPCWRTAISYAASAPGTPLASAPTLLARVSGLPFLIYMSRLAADGAISRPSITTNLPSANRITMKHPPPMPLLYPLTTPRVSPAATAPSTALPPFFIAAMAASVAIGSTVATAPCLAAVRGIEVARRATRNFFMPQVSVMMRNVQCWFQLAVYMFHLMK